MEKLEAKHIFAYLTDKCEVRNSVLGSAFMMGDSNVSHIKNGGRSFGYDVFDTGNGFEKDKIKPIIKALSQLTSFQKYLYKEGVEYEFIDEIKNMYKNEDLDSDEIQKKIMIDIFDYIRYDAMPEKYYQKKPVVTAKPQRSSFQPPKKKNDNYEELKEAFKKEEDSEGKAAIAEELIEKYRSRMTNEETGNVYIALNLPEKALECYGLCYSKVGGRPADCIRINLKSAEAWIMMGKKERALERLKEVEEICDKSHITLVSSMKYRYDKLMERINSAE